MTDFQPSVVVIRATARIQETDEPTRQRSIIKLTQGDHNNNNNFNNSESATQLANAIRASIDSGRDNPFRPDGEIYKLTNPIVDYYKFGANQSPRQTPTYAELVNGQDGGICGKQRQHNYNHQANNTSKTESTRRPCWRRWFCCCCCCCCRWCGHSSDNEHDEQYKATTNGGSHGERIAAPNGSDAGASPEQQVRVKRKNNKKKITSNDLTTLTLPIVDAIQSDSSGVGGQHQANTKKQTKVVLVDVGTNDNEAPDQADAAKKAPAKERAKKSSHETTQVTQVKKTGNRCVIS